MLRDGESVLPGIARGANDVILTPSSARPPGVKSSDGCQVGSASGLPLTADMTGTQSTFG